MSITCQITQLGTDRIRLDVPGLTRQPETSQNLTQFLLGLPGVTGVEMRPASESIIVQHDGLPASRNAILQTLRGKPAEEAASGVTVQPGTVPAQSVRLPYARCTVAHALRGRVRLHIPDLDKNATLASVLTWRLEQQAGVRRVRLNRWAGNVVVAYDPAALDARTIVETVTAYQPDAAAIAAWQAALLAARSTPAQLGRRRKIEAGLAAVALALTLLTGAAFVWVVYALLLVCAGSILQRTYKAPHKGRILIVETGAAVAMVLAGLTGALWLSAVIPILVFSWPRLRVWSQSIVPMNGARTSTLIRSGAALQWAAHAISALPKENPRPQLGEIVAATAAPAAPASEEIRLHIPQEFVAIKPAALVMPVAPAQTFSGPATVVGTSSSSGGATWIANPDSFRTPVSRKVNG